MVNTEVLVGIIVFLFVIITQVLIFALSYKKASPSEILIVTRRAAPPQFQFQAISGGGKFIIPFGEEYHILSTAVWVFDMTIERVKVESAGGPRKVDVELTGLLRISKGKEPLKDAYKDLINKEGPDIVWMAKKVIEEHGRAYLTSRTFEEINEDLEETAAMTGMEAFEALRSKGIEIRDIAIRDIRIKGGMA